MTTAAERFAHISSYELRRKPGTVVITPIDENQILAKYAHGPDFEDLAARAEARFATDLGKRERELVEFERARRVVTAGIGGCIRCKAKAALGSCCSSHDKELCHGCYRRTHFVEICVEGCSDCAREGLNPSGATS